MRLTHFGHSCLLVDIDETRILFDPGVFSHGFEGLTGLDAVLVTHQHPDHADTARLPAIVEANPRAALFADPQTAAQLGGSWQAARPGDVLSVKNVEATVGGGKHAIIHPEIPNIDNVAYLLGVATDGNGIRSARFMHPGDSLTVPRLEVDVLALPATAPWMKISEAVDYLRAVAPRLAVPIHQAILSAEGSGIYYGRLAEMAPAGSEFRALPAEEDVVVA
jgi:L-ascorbate metabolism protein UlaG (beta-lactamase superfamily)